MGAFVISPLPSMLLESLQSVSSHQSVCDDPCCLRPMKKSSAPGIPFRGYVCVDSLRPDDSLTILSMASSIGSRDSVSFLLTIQATGLLTFTLVGLSPTEIRQPS